MRCDTITGRMLRPGMVIVFDDGGEAVVESTHQVYASNLRIGVRLRWTVPGVIRDAGETVVCSFSKREFVTVRRLP